MEDSNQLLHSSGDSITAMQSDPLNDGGSIPTSPLHRRLRKNEWTVASVDINVARNIVEKYHYAKGASRTGVYIHGLFPYEYNWHEQCVGVAWWLPPTRVAAEYVAGEGWRGVLSLSRLCVDPSIPPNACSFIISKSVRLIDQNKWHTLVTYADSWRGHTGSIYKAAGWKYAGQTLPTPIYIKNGRMIAKRATKNRTHLEMLELGATMIGKFSKSRFVLYRNKKYNNAVSFMGFDE